jgi:ketosteroid isomerase-like protein
MTAEHPNAALVRRACAAQAKADLEAYLALLSEDFVLHIPGRSRIAGEYRGRHVWHVRGGELAELWLHSVDQDAFDAYWGRAVDSG